MDNLNSRSNVYLGLSAGCLNRYAGNGRNVGVGMLALGNDANGYNNTACGAVALQALTTGTNNVAVGYAAGTAVLDSANNVLIGSQALSAATGGGAHTVVGYQALDNLTGTHYCNTVIGANAGQLDINGNPATGLENCTLLGYDTRTYTATDNRTTVIGKGVKAAAASSTTIGGGDANQVYLLGTVRPYGGVIFPSADPHVAGAWWDNNGVLTKSAG